MTVKAIATGWSLGAITASTFIDWCCYLHLVSTCWTMFCCFAVAVVVVAAALRDGCKTTGH